MMIECPKCRKECEGEVPNKPWYLCYECEFGFEFNYDCYQDIMYDIDGNQLKGGDTL